MDSNGHLTTAITYRNLPITTAEALAIAHATTTHQHKPYLTIITDSQQACHLYPAGFAPSQAPPVLQRLPKDIEVLIIWTPGHAGFAGNEAAHATALDLLAQTLPSTRTDTARHLISNHKDLTPLDSTYSSLLVHYTHTHITYPPPHQRLRTQTFYNHAIL